MTPRYCTITLSTTPTFSPSSLIESGPPPAYDLRPEKYDLDRIPIVIINNPFDVARLIT
jgi:hypothetical protein